MSDPYLILGLPEDADDAAVHAAYRAVVKACPPERDPRRFEAVRAAYEALRTRRHRLAYALFDTDPPDLAELLARAAFVERARRAPDSTGAGAADAGPGETSGSAGARAAGRPERALFAALLRGEP